MAIGSKSSRANLVVGCATCVGEADQDSSNSLDSGERLADNSSTPDAYECPKCEKHFGHARVLQLHLRVHESRLQLSPQHPEETSCSGGRADDVPASHQVRPSESEYGDDPDERLQFPACQLPVRKAAGLTKVRLEDCLRCDACSCIYLEQSDYDKHMKNFHRHDSPKKHRQKKGCRSCCRHCNCRGDHQHQSIQKERGNNNLFHYNIKDRWTKMVSRRLNPDELKQEIKPDPDDCPDGSVPSIDYSHLLSQVEVKIKVEPTEEQDLTIK